MNNYDDIINLPHPTSKNHPRMSMYQRAAQFAPFAALTGHGAAIRETARLTDSQIELSEQEKVELDRKFHYIINNIKSNISATITYFVEDAHKSGGRYVSTTGTIKKFDEFESLLTLEGGIQVSLSSIIDIQIKKKA